MEIFNLWTCTTADLYTTTLIITDEFQTTRIHFLMDAEGYSWKKRPGKQSCVLLMVCWIQAKNCVKQTHSNFQQICADIASSGCEYINKYTIA